MSTGQYTHVTRNAGEIVTADLYNGAHQNQKQNDIPTSCGAHADDLAMFQATTDPAPGGVATPVAALGDELEQLRFVLADIKTVLNGGTPPAQWYTPVTFDATLVQARGARVSRSSSQSITSDTLTPISFNTVAWDTGVALPTFDPFFAIGQPTRLTARATGVYQINGNIEWAATGAGIPLRVAIRVNGNTNIASTAQAVISSNQRFLEVGVQYTLNENDYVELIAYQNTGSPVNVLAGAQFALELLSLSAAFTPPTLFTLTVDPTGDGTGTITAASPATINCPGTCTEDFVDGTVVSLTATPTVGVFGGWTGDVPVGHENDNPLSVTMDQARTIQAVFNVFAAWVTVSTNGGASPFVPSTANPFFVLGNGTIKATAALASGRMPVAITVDRISGQLSVALTGAQTVTLRLNINGVGNNTLTVVLTSASGTSFLSSIAPLALAQDDLVCWEATAFGGGLTSVSIKDISLRYSGLSGFVVGHTDYGVTVANTELPVFGTGVSTSITFVNAAWVPKQVTIGQGTIAADVAPGGVTATNVQIRTNNGASSTGGLLTLSGANTSVRSTITATLPAAATGVTSENHDALRSSTGSPAAGNARLWYSYVAAAPDAAFSFYFTGRNGFNHAGLGGTPFPPIQGFNTAGSFSNTEAQGQIRWPVTGKFKYFGARGGTTAGTTFNLIFRVNGVDTAVVLSYSGVTSFQGDNVTEVPVTAGDLVNWRVTRTGGSAVTLDLVAWCGFVTT